MFDGEAFGQQMVEIVRGYVDAELAPLRAENEALAARVKELEARPAPEKGDPGEPGQDAAVPSLEAVWSEMRPRAEELIREAVESAVAALPPPERGEPGEDGKSIDPGAVEEMVENAVSKAVAELPPPKDGNDGRGVKDLLIDRDGNLVATMDDGEMKSLGPVIGKDGDPGKDGRDGIDLTSFEAIVLDDDRTIELKFISGEEERVASFKWPAPIYRGVFKEGVEYAQGDVVTWAGSQWHCDEPTSDKPGTEKWTLSCKKGRDGKDAARG